MLSAQHVIFGVYLLSRDIYGWGRFSDPFRCAAVWQDCTSVSSSLFDLLSFMMSLSHDILNSNSTTSAVGNAAEDVYGDGRVTMVTISFCLPK